MLFTTSMQRPLSSPGERGEVGDGEKGAAGNGERGAAADAGFTFLGLMVVIAVINIGLGVAATSWVTINKRAKEAELIWRGQQYVRALQCHRQQTGGLPDDLDELLDSDCIRALYSDPMGRNGAWRVIRESDLRMEGDRGGSTGSLSGALDISVNLQTGQAELSLGLPGRGAGSGIQLGLGSLSAPGAGGGSRGAAPGGGGATRAAGRGNQTDSLQAAYQRLRTLSQRLNDNFSRSTGDGIVGVVSASTGEALRLYQGEATYDAWRFVVQ